MPQEKIIIKFKPDGHDKLIKALNNLATAQKKVVASTAPVTAATKKSGIAMNTTAKSAGILDTRNKRLAKTNTFLANTFATLRSKLLLGAFAMT